jgi:phage terminase large subunit-like protein
MSDLSEIATKIATLDYIRSTRRLEYYKPYSYQERFHNAPGLGTQRPARQRLLMAANKVGKTYCSAMEVAIHATGRYPIWWKGSRFLYAPEILVCGLTNDSVRDLGQRELLGDPTDDKQLGTGTIPKTSVGKRRNKTGVPNAYDSVRIQHVSGQWSKIYFRAYEQGWKKFQGIAADVIWPDEEPPPDIWSQLIRATLAKPNAIIFCSMTPEEGMTETVTQFMENLQKGQALITSTWDDAPHLTPEVKEQRLAALRPHERDMRSKGIPLQGAGLIFPISDDDLVIDPIEIPRHWPQIIGVDFGISTQHPFSACNWAWDRDSDTKYLTHEYQTTNDMAAVHADAIKSWGSWKPVAWPHDGLNREKGSGDELHNIYRSKGLNLLPWKATNPPKVGQYEGEGGNSTEASVLSMLDDMYGKKIRVFKTCTTFLKEKRMYHRDLKGKIVRMHEDMICAARYAHMMIRHSRTVSVLPRKTENSGVGMRNWA